MAAEWEGQPGRELLAWLGPLQGQVLQAEAAQALVFSIVHQSSVLTDSRRLSGPSLVSC